MIKTECPLCRWNYRNQIMKSRRKTVEEINKDKQREITEGKEVLERIQKRLI